MFNWSELHFSEVTSYKIHILVDAACKPKFKQEDQDKIKGNDTRTTLRKNNLQIRTHIIQLCFWQIFETMRH